MSNLDFLGETLLGKERYQEVSSNFRQELKEREEKYKNDPAERERVRKSLEEYEKSVDRNSDAYKVLYDLDGSYRYHNWNWSALPPTLIDKKVDEWKEKYGTDPETLYKLLYRDEYGSQWYHINNYMSYNAKYSFLPNPSDKVYKGDKGFIEQFYSKEVPYAGAWVTWYQQVDQSKIYPIDRFTNLSGYTFRSPDSWFQRKANNLADDLGGAGGIGFGAGLFVAGAIGVGLIYASNRV